MWLVIKNINGFEGIKPLPQPHPISDGSYNLKLSPDNYKIFQENLKKSAAAHEAEEPKTAPTEAPDAKTEDGKPKDAKPEGGKPKDAKPEDAKPKSDKPEDAKPEDADKPTDSISVTQDPSMLNQLIFDESQHNPTFIPIVLEF